MLVILDYYYYWRNILTYASLAWIIINTIGASALSITDTTRTNVLSGLNVAIVGGGPAGLLAAHRLLNAGSTVSLFESRGDPRIGKVDDDRAYALGVGIRGRSAIQTVDDDLWNAVKSCGFPCDKFVLHPTPSISFTLRDDKRAMQKGGEPSMLLFQNDLCTVLLDELEKRHKGNNQLKLHFDTKIDKVSMIDTETESQKYKLEPSYDFVIGCDGVKSKVRDSMMSHAPNTIKSTVREIPGLAKVVNVPMPSSETLDPGSVHLIIPKGTGAGTVTAFVEPTIKGTCILFAGRVKEDTEDERPQVLAPRASFDGINAKTYLGSAMRDAFPLLSDQLTDEVIDNIARQNGFSSSAIKCNIYHCGLLALCGDAAHATGGVSGQGCNSALIDASVLVDCLEKAFMENPDVNDRTSTIKSALLQYSQKQVPEGSALYELSIGPDKDVSMAKRLLSGVSALYDFIFKEKLTIQAVLGSSLKPFSAVRRERGIFFDELFLSENEFKDEILMMHNKISHEISPSADKVLLKY